MKSLPGTNGAYGSRVCTFLQVRPPDGGHPGRGHQAATVSTREPDLRRRWRSSAPPYPWPCCWDRGSANLAAPIVRLTLGSERIARGNLDHRVPVQGRDETRLLAESFNKMTNTLREAILHRDREIGSRKEAESALSLLNRDLASNGSAAQPCQRSVDDLCIHQFARLEDAAAGEFECWRIGSPMTMRIRSMRRAESTSICSQSE